MVLLRSVDLIVKANRIYWKVLPRTETFGGDLVLPGGRVNTKVGAQLGVGRGIEGSRGSCLPEVRIGGDTHRGLGRGRQAGLCC